MGWLVASISGMPMKLFVFLIYFVIHVAGAFALHSSSTANLVTLVRQYREVQNVLSIVCLDVHCTVLDAVMGFIIVSKLQR